MNERTEPTGARRDTLRETDEEARALARLLLRTARYAALAVLDPESGTPLASRVATATDLDGTPLILVSALSAHTGALLADPRCSLLLGEPGRGDPLAHPRMTLVCEAERLDRASPLGQSCRRRYLARQPKASLYVDFPDFSFFRLMPLRASLNGGFGRAYALDAGDILDPLPDRGGFEAMEGGAVAHMNTDHADAIAVYAEAFAKPTIQDPQAGWLISGIDPSGLDLMLGDRAARVAFPQALGSPSEVRPALVALARDGRARLAAQ